MHQVFFVKFW
ncbi:hypothetical protein F383_16204 [Gossypium arboreum]|uniref:Uncharacterized protein n=1 Tax=Gossypium arboreum TaxID=29729 RepID=A0A0B0MSC3_GOSAR|nr:hypothetical protein F383_21744 [Gossypium arboreum]KHG27821.1 hypothetical protein F383_16204 [Gossypium arboreum]